MDTLQHYHRPAAELAMRPQQRTNGAASAAVEQAIAVQHAFSTLCAIEYLKSNNVQPAVIERVLLHPEQRRAVVR